MPEYVTVEVEIPGWMEKASREKGIDLSELLIYSLQSELGYEEMSSDDRAEYDKWFGSLG